MSQVTLSNGIQVNYNYQQVAPEAETLVFLNGTFNTMGDWSGISEEITEKRAYNILTFDMRNQGQSTCMKEDFSYNDMIEDMELFFEALQLSSFTMITYSSASTLAIDYINRHPGKVKRLILGAPVINPFGMFRNQLISKASLSTLEHGGIKDMIVLSFPLMFSAGFVDQMKEHFSAIQGQFQSAFDQDVLLAFMKAWDQNNMSLEKISTVVNSVETHCIIGEFDIFNPEIHLNQLRAQLEGMKLHTIKNCGHAFHMENMGEYTNLLKRLLA